MTRKDYRLIAGAIRQVAGLQYGPEATDALDSLARELANRLQADNPRFKTSYFLEACQPTDK